MGAKDQLAVNTIRMLSAEAIQKAKSGHPGLPMGAAPMAWALFSRCLKHSPGNPGWVDRDRFILSAGHGSMLLYSLLHLFGYGITIEDIKNFRQWGSPCAGHPEYGLAKGIETTTGPLGQGLANAVGFAIAEAHLAAKFNRESYDIVSHNTYVLVSDGCMMEGVTAEASSLAGMLKLSKLIVLYDSNDVTIEGSTGMAFTEDVGRRYEAYGWNVLKVPEGNDVEKITRAIEKAKRSDRPTLIIVKTQIAYGSPLEGSARSHGEPLGEENIRLTREKLCYGCPPFTVPDEVSKMMKILKKDADKHEARWDALFERYEKAHPILAAEWKAWHSGALPEGLEDDASLFNFGGASIVSTRTASGEVLNKLAAKMPNIIGGSADLGPSNKSVLKGKEYIRAGDF
ncbi:MAG: transketolase, partial [Bacillota bacterium]|nr:transketolase [Bacillota bacterium]